MMVRGAACSALLQEKSFRGTGFVEDLLLRQAADGRQTADSTPA
jgi:hypothetical protein